MPISFKQAGSLFVAGPNISIFPSGNTYAISGSASGSGSGSGVTGVTSAGTGNILIFSSTTVNKNLVQKSLSASTGIAIIENAGTLIFSSTSASNGTIISGTNAGTGFPIFSAAVGSNLVFRRILSGTNIGVYTVGNDIVISGTTGAINGVTGVTNIGGAASVLSSVTSGILVSRTISGSGGIDATESGNFILIKPTNTSANRLYIAGTGGLLTTDAAFGADTTTGSIGIGGAAVTTTRLFLAFGTASVSQLRLEKYAATYTGATDGDIWYNTVGNTLKFKKSGTTTDFIFKDNNQSLTGTTTGRILETDITGTLSATKLPTTIGVFNVITSKTISNTIVETSILTTGGTFMYGTNLLNSSNHTSNPQLIAGKKYRFNSRGIISGTSGTFYGEMVLGSVLIASSSTFTLATSLSGGSYFEVDTTFTITDVGASGKVIGSGKMMTDNTLLSTTSPIVSIASLSSKTINTTSDQYFDFFIKFSSANTRNAVIMSEATLEYLN